MATTLEEPDVLMGPEVSDVPKLLDAPVARVVYSWLDESFQVVASVGWTPMAADSMGWLAARLMAERLEGRFRPGIRI